MKKTFAKILSFLSVLLFVSYSNNFNTLHAMEAQKSKISNIPTTLEESCLELDKIFNSEQKEQIKNSAHDFRTSYIGKLYWQPIGKTVKSEWLLEDGDETTALCKLLLEHGARFDGSMEINLEMFWVILENYRHYLLTGECVPSIEDLMIDYWYYDFIFFNGNASEQEKNKQRAILTKAMEKWKSARDTYKKRLAITSACNIL